MRFSPHPVTLRQLQYLLAVDQTRSFHGAAALCHVSQPSLSSQIAEAESALGCQVFERNHRRVLVTPAGELLLKRARQLLLDTDDFVDQAQRAADPLQGVLRIGVIPTLCPYLLPDIAPHLRQQFPTLSVVWSEQQTRLLINQLSDGSLDAALLALEAEIGELAYQEIDREPFMLAVPPQHPLAKGRSPVNLGELKSAEIMLLREGHCLRDQTIEACRKSRFHPYAATSLATLVQMVASGAGITLLPRLAVAYENRNQALVIRRFAPPSPGRTLALAWRPNSPLAGGLQILATAIANVVKAAR